MINLRRAQTIMEYMVLLTVITAAVIVMLPAIKRTTQSFIKSAADQIGDQAGSEQNFNIDSGYLSGMNSKTKATINNLRTESNGTIDQEYNETVSTRTRSRTEMGWTPN